MGDVQTQIDYPKGVTFEQVWAALMENREQQKETARQMKENQQETERFLKENAAALNKQIGSLTNLFGDFTVGMIIPKINDKFYDLGLVFPEASPNRTFNDKANGLSFEIDIMLENGDKAMLIEVKTKLTVERINKHIERLEKMRRYADIHGDKRKFLGSVAGFTVTDEVREVALKEGFYLIEPSGENFNITPPNNKPKEW